MQVIEAFRRNPERNLLRPWYAERPGNPCIIGSEYFAEVLDHDGGERGCFYLFERHAESTLNLKVDAAAFVRDVDRPDDLLTDE